MSKRRESIQNRLASTIDFRDKFDTKQFFIYQVNFLCAGGGPLLLKYEESPEANFPYCLWKRRKIFRELENTKFADQRKSAILFCSLLDKMTNRELLVNCVAMKLFNRHEAVLDPLSGTGQSLINAITNLAADMYDHAAGKTEKDLKAAMKNED